MTKNKKAGARALSCACALALAASMAPAAALAWGAGHPGVVQTDAKNVVQVYVVDGDGNQLYAEYVTLPDPAAATPVKGDKGLVNEKGLNKTQSVMGWDGSSAWNVVTTENYVTFDSILETAGVTDAWWNDRAKVSVFETKDADGTDKWKIDNPTTNNNYSVSYGDFYANKSFYGATTNEDANTDKNPISEVTPGVALYTVTGSVVDAGSGTNTTTGAQAGKNKAEYSEDTGSTTNQTYTFLHGTNATDVENKGASAKKASFPAATTTGTESGLTITVTVPKPEKTQRIYGSTWADTMRQTMAYNASYTDMAGKMKNFVLATADSYQDALAASSLAGSMTADGLPYGSGSGESDVCAPIVMTSGSELTAQAASIFNYYADSTAECSVYVVGGKKAISEDVVKALKALPGFKGGANVQRVKGDEAWDTALEIRNLIAAKADKSAADTTNNENAGWRIDTESGSGNAIVCTSGGFQDALSIAPYAYRTGTPIVLTNGEAKLTDAASKLVNRMTNVWVIGGRKAVSADVTDSQLTAPTVKRVYGETAYDTSNQIAYELYDTSGVFGSTAFKSATTVAFATGENYLDALGSSSFCGNGAAPTILLLVSNDDQTTVDGFLSANAKNNTSQGGAVTTAKLFGGSAAISNLVQSEIETTLL